MSRPRRVGLCAAAACTVVLAGWPARAEQAKTDRVAAEALFRDARALVEAGSWEEGCKKFEASLALQPSASTMLNIARCDEHAGKSATAWGDYRRTLALNRETKGEERQRQLESITKRGILALEPRLPRLRVVVKGSPARLEVRRDGTVLPAGALGEPLPADPGPHEITATAPSHGAEKRRVTLEEGETTTVEISLAPVQAAARPPVPSWVWITGASGLALGGAAALFAIEGASAMDALSTHCEAGPVGTSCSDGYDYHRDNQRKNRGVGMAIGLGAASAIALGVAVTGLVLSTRASPRDAIAAPWIGPNGAGVVFVGARFMNRTEPATGDS